MALPDLRESGHSSVYSFMNSSSVHSFTNSCSDCRQGVFQPTACYQRCSMQSRTYYVMRSQACPHVLQAAQLFSEHKQAHKIKYGATRVCFPAPHGAGKHVPGMGSGLCTTIAVLAMRHVVRDALSTILCRFRISSQRRSCPCTRSYTTL